MTAAIPGLDVRTVSLQPVAVIALDGDLDIASTTTLDADLTRRFSEHTNHVVLDLRGVQFVDSTGLSSLVRAKRALDRDGRRLSMVTTRGPLQRALELTGLERAFDVRASVEDAVAELGGRRASGTSEAVSAASARHPVVPPSRAERRGRPSRAAG